MIQIKTHNKMAAYLKKWASTVLILPIIIFLIVNEGNFIFIDYVNLLIHEGGHGVFILFGKFIYTLGGTIMQLLIPMLFVIYYAKERKKVLLQIFLLWLGESFINVSVYAADASAKRLPLFGGKNVYHDWSFLLNELGILKYDYLVGSLFFYCGVIVFLIALFVPLIIKDYQNSRIKLNL